MRFCKKVVDCYLLAAVVVFAVWQMTLRPVASVCANDITAAGRVAHQDSTEKGVKCPPEESDNLDFAKPKDRAASIRAIVSHLGLGEGSVIADIGAGRGRDTWVFAETVGETGTVFAEEIVENMVRSLESEAKKKGLDQVRSVLGRADDPCLPPDSVDLAFMCHVYHHFAKPREMLRGIWRCLKPGGRLVVADRHLGTLRDWVPRHLREKKHFWIAETTVVREAREEGFAFAECAEQCWYEKDHFVLVFQRPKELKSPGRDPDEFRHISAKDCSCLFLPLARPYQQPVFVALGEGRKLMAPILENSSGKGLDIVLEEWATQKDERPPLLSDVSLPSVLTDNGDPHLGDGPVDVVFFLDSYHLLFHGKTLLDEIHKKLTPTGCVYVLDRRAKEPLSRREASHRRKIQPKTVRQEMAEAGFFLWFHGPRVARDRFLLVFGKDRPRRVPPEENPFVAGPAIPEPPGQWLKRNHWRFLGFRAANGKTVLLKARVEKGSVRNIAGGSPGRETWEIPEERLRLHFEKKDEKYSLTNYTSSE